MSEQARVFLSYSVSDRLYAELIFEELQSSSTPVFIDRVNLGQGEQLLSAMRSQIAASDFLVLLLSPDALESAVVRRELEYALSTDLRQRSITVVPIKVKPCEVPAYMEQWTVLDATRDLNRGIKRLSQLLKAAPKVQLDSLSPQRFEELVGELLRSYGFRNVETARPSMDFGYDFSAQSVQHDPFGRPEVVEWIIQVKSSRLQTDTSTLRAFLGALSLRNERGLFVTSSQLTSPAKSWLDYATKPGAPRISFLEGTDVRRLVMAKPRLIKSFFGGKGAK